MMANAPSEQSIRKMLPILRLSLAYTPLWVMRWLQKFSEKRQEAIEGVKCEVVSADGVRCEWLIPENSPKDQVLYYIHGGGWTYGWMDPHRLMVAKLAQISGMRALAVDYRLAPENPFPVGLDDCVTAYRWLLKQGVAPQNIVIAGDSAGGNLTLATLLKLKQTGEPLPAAAVCLSPATNLTNRTDFFKDTYDALLHPKATEAYRLGYVGNNDPLNPLISPAFADLSGLPPLLIHAAKDEFLHHDAVNLEKAAREAGVDVRLEVYPTMWHVWQIYYWLPESQKSLADIAQFMKSQLGVLANHPS
jgi:monoterpene epsilon-lactone hydrolase